MFIKLQCRTCDNIDCQLGRKVIPEDSLEGCTREVSEDLAAQYYHATEEVLPFVLLGKNPDSSWEKLEEITRVQEQVYQQTELQKPSNRAVISVFNINNVGPIVFTGFIYFNRIDPICKNPLGLIGREYLIIELCFSTIDSSACIDSLIL